MLLKEEASVVILAGGQGTRVKTLYPDIPKPMIPIAGRPFIEWVIKYFMRQGLRRFVVVLGHLAHVAEEYFRHRPPDGASITTICEPLPLGTGGAVLFAQKMVPLSDPLIVANGDSLILADLCGSWTMLECPSVDGVVVGVPVEDTSRYGALKVGADSLLLAFHEKKAGRGLINAGVYFFKQRILKHFLEQTPLSLETEVFPALLRKGAKILVHPCEAPFLDVGTPQDLKEAEGFIEKNFPKEVCR